MKQRKIYILLGGMMAMLASSGCSREQLDNIVSSAAEVQFGASSMWQTEPGTRTEYSGDKVQVGTAWKERINWVKTTDRIRIYSPQAYKMYDSNTHIADYYISSDPDPRDEKSQAKIACVDKNGLQWSNSSDHHFYALYPAPGTEWKYDQSVSVPEASAMIEASGTEGAKITGFIPTVQEVKYHDETSPTRKEYEPNMNYAYMYAVKRNVTRGSSVSLSFQPLVTTLQFTIKASDANAANLTLTGFKLKSSTVNLYGSFTATFSESSDTPTISISATDTGKEVSVSIPNDDRKKLSTNDLIMVTVFTLPVELKNLTIEMTFLNSSSQTVYRTLDLKSKSGSTTSWITVPACHKAYINSLGVPGAVWDYHLDVVNPTDLIAVGGTSTTARVTSYRQHTTTGTREAVGWTIQGYYSNAACTQNITRPSWITNITSSGSGTLPGSSESMTIAYDASPAGTSTTTSNSTLKNTTDLGSTSSYKNLSNPSNMDSDNIAESANCYIVNQPGYYKIPLVEGNGIINNAKNKDNTTYLGASGTNQKTFVNFITNSADAVYLSDIGATWRDNCYPDTFEVIWEDVSGLISGMSITSDHKWLCFRVAGTTQGNALINVRQGSLTMWQYHIWVTDFIPYNYPGYSSSTYGKDVTVTGSNSTTYAMMPLNLGWVGGDKTTTPYPERKVYAKLVQTGGGTGTAVLEVKQAEMVTVKYSGGRAPYFQWGRKDPFQPFNPAANGTWKNLHTQEGALQSDYWVTFRFLDGYGPSPGSTQFTFWLGTSANSWDWLGLSNASNFWNASNTSTGTNTGAVRKTIYDPCPAGYCMPVEGAFSGFTSNRNNFNSKNTFGNWDDGWHIFTNASKRETIYFPSHGYLGNGTYSTDGGCYWTADTKASAGYVFRFSVGTSASPFFYPDHSHSRYFGCSVRPVRDTNKAN